MSALEDKVNELYLATKDLKSFEELAPHCEKFNEWIAKESKLSLSTIASKLSTVGFYKKFRAIPMEQGKNAVLVNKHDKDGNPTGVQELKHYVAHHCGLSSEQWKSRNETKRNTEKLDNNEGKGQEVIPETFIEVTKKLLNSDDPHELAVGLIAATGRRPHEILARAVFSAIADEPYKVIFKGQGKKYGKLASDFIIGTLFPASQIIKCLKKLRSDSGNKEMLMRVAKEFPNDIVKQNKSIEDGRGNSLRRIVKKYFGSAELNLRANAEDNDCKALRAACACLITDRDYVGSLGGKMRFFGEFLGHIDSSQKSNDSELSNIVTSLGYADFYTTNSVPFPVEDNIIKTAITVSAEVRDSINDLKKELQVDSQSEVISKLVGLYADRIGEVKSQDYIDSLLARIKELEEKATAPTKQVAKNWQTVTHKELWHNPDGTGNRSAGSQNEKIRRSFQAIANYNNMIATGDNDRLAINNSCLRSLSGVNGIVVAEWIKAHADEIISHNSKFGMGNSKDPSKAETYYNKKHGVEKVDRILKFINTELLDGAASV